MVTKYQKRISGPLLDRIDIHIEVPRVDYEKLSGDRLGESSASIRLRVQAARNIQQTRFTKPEIGRLGSSPTPDIVCNADMRVAEVRQFCQLQEEGKSLMRSAMTQLNLSARAYHRILKLARMTADLAGSDETEPVHLTQPLLILLFKSAILLTIERVRGRLSTTRLPFRSNLEFQLRWFAPRGSRAASASLQRVDRRDR